MTSCNSKILKTIYLINVNKATFTYKAIKTVLFITFNSEYKNMAQIFTFVYILIVFLFSFLLEASTCMSFSQYFKLYYLFRHNIISPLNNIVFSYLVIQLKRPALVTKIVV